MAEKTFGAYVALTGWYDPDTFYGVLDQGRGSFHGGGMELTTTEPEEGPRVVIKPIRHRAAKIQAVEKGTPREEEILDIVRKAAPPGIYQCVTYKADDNFDRPLVDLILPSTFYFSEFMLANGYARKYR